jgi:hypothetical protein
MEGEMRNHLNWLFLFLFGIALIGCQDDITVNNPINSNNGLSKDAFASKLVIENITTDLVVTGTGILTAGTGMEPGGTGTINLNVPAGYTINKVYLYWEGRHNSVANPDGDPDVVVNGITIVGEMIGKAALDNPRPAYTHRADITSRNLVTVGNNTLNLSGFDASGGYSINRPNGAGIIVVYSEAGKTGNIEIKDGADFAFVLEGSPNPNFINKQTFTFPSATFSRQAVLNIFVGDLVEDEKSGNMRPHYMIYKVGTGSEVKLTNPFSQNGGPEWETYKLNINIPAGATQVEVQLFSGPGDANTKPLPASLCWVTAALTVPVPSLLAEVGDRIWKDLNKNGIQDQGEEGFPGVTVALYKCDGTWLNKILITDANGYYLFTNLEPGSYKVRMEIPSGWTLSPQNVGLNDAVDSDFLPATDNKPYTECFELSPGESDLTWDGGLYPAKSSLGDRIWIDSKDNNCNGIQDVGELGLAGVTVELWNCDLTSKLKTTTTDASGNYLFTDLDAGCYKVKVLLPAGYAFAPQNQGSDDSKDSDVNPSGGVTANINLGTAADDLTNDAGLCPLKSQLGDRVWIDSKDNNCNGIQDPGELGLAGVTVNLYKCSDLNTIFKTTTTNADGNYLFTDLDAGCYKVKVILPAGYAFSSQNQGSDDALDSDVNSGGVTADINLGTAAVDLTNDAGLCPQLGKLGDRVWKDMNCDGFQDDNEIGVPGVTVQLFKCGSTTVFKTTTTDILGNYLFTDLPQDCYQVKFILPTGYAFTVKDLYNNLLDTRDSDADPITGSTANINLASAQDDRTWDAGLCPLPPVGKLGDKVWKDMNCDGFQGDNEPGVAGVTVELYKCGITAVFKTTATDILGNYLFTDLPEGCYQVKFVLPSGYAFTVKDLYNNLLDAFDSDADPITGLTTNINLAAAQDDRTWDAGLCPQELSKLGDKVWKDSNCNGIQDNGELGLQGVKVELYTCGATTPIKSAFTDADGNYLFIDLVPGCYFVKVILPTGYNNFAPQNQGADDTKDSDVNNSGVTANINLAPGQDDRTWDAGLCPNLAELGNYVWYDVDVDGIQDGNELGIPNVKVELYDCTGSLKGSTFTNSSGLYLFSNLNAGDYKVKFYTPSGYFPTLKDKGANDAVDSDADSATGFTVCTNLSLGESDLTWDAGFFKPDSMELCADNRVNVKYNVGTLYWYKLSSGNYKAILKVSKGLNDNTYGTGAVGWPNGHTFSNLTGSDKAQFVFKNGNGQIVLNFILDYVSSGAFPSGYGSLGVSGGDGSISVGSASNIVSFNTSIARNLNQFGYVLTTNSPSTNSSYAPNPSYPNWIYDMIYEVEVSASVFGASGFGSVMTPSWHNSPNKLNYDNGLVAYDCNGPIVKQCTDKIAAVLFAYTGPNLSNVTVKFQGRDGGVATYPNVNLTYGTILQTGDWTVSALPGNFGTTFSVYINGVLQEIHHTSCSTPYSTNSPAPLDSGSPGNPTKGTPSPNWFVANFRDADDVK